MISALHLWRSLSSTIARRRMGRHLDTRPPRAVYGTALKLFLDHCGKITKSHWDKMEGMLGVGGLGWGATVGERAIPCSRFTVHRLCASQHIGGERMAGMLGVGGLGWGATVGERAIPCSCFTEPSEAEASQGTMSMKEEAHVQSYLPIEMAEKFIAMSKAWTPHLRFGDESVSVGGKPTAACIEAVDRLLCEQDVIKIAVDVDMPPLFYGVLQHESKGFILQKDGRTFLLHKHPFASYHEPPSGPYDAVAFECYKRGSHYVDYFYMHILTEEDVEPFMESLYEKLNLKSLYENLNIDHNVRLASSDASDIALAERLRRIERVEAFNLLPLSFTNGVRESWGLPRK